MNTQEIARGGLLAGFAVVLLYIAALIPQAAPALCISAGIVTALPLLRSRTVKGSVTVYAAVSALSVILVPRKSIAAAYIMATGLYPIVKFLIENRTRPMVQMPLKLGCVNLVFAVTGTLVSKGIFPMIQVPGFAALAVFWAAVNVGFIAFDVVLTQFIRFLRRYLPKL